MYFIMHVQISISANMHEANALTMKTSCTWWCRESLL